LQRDSFAVSLLVCGEWVVGFKRTYRKPREILKRKIPIGVVSGGEHVLRTTYTTQVWCIRGDDGKVVDLPAWAEPMAFRPLIRDKYPDPLPDPLTQTEEVAWASPIAPPSCPEIPDSLEWKGEYNLPGRISRGEAEIRLLRGLRTERSRKSQVRGGSTSGDMDSLLRLILRTQGRLEYEHKESLSTQLAHVGELWEPTRRDHGDWSTAVTWFNKLDKEHRHVVKERSYNPQTSYRQIGEAMQRSEGWARKVYGQAIDRVEKIANMHGK
jgi:hypothetical protein